MKPSSIGEPVYVILESTYLPWLTLGELILPNGIKFKTIEPKWMLNIPYISCIPERVYICSSRISPRFGSTYEVKKVINRSHILFHALNSVTETKGCIGLGREHIITDKEIRLTNSRAAVQDFMSALDGVDEFKLIMRIARPKNMGVSQWAEI